MQREGVAQETDIWQFQNKKNLANASFAAKATLNNESIYSLTYQMIDRLLKLRWSDRLA